MSVTPCPVCQTPMEPQPVNDLTSPWYCPQCDCCYGFLAVDIVMGRAPKWEKLNREPMRRIYGPSGVPVWEPGRPVAPQKPGWYK